MSEARLLGVRIDPQTLPQLLERARAAISARKTSLVFACANPHSLVVAQRDGEFRRALDAATAVVADGVGCQVGARLGGVELGPRITGSDFFLGLMQEVDRRAGKAYFFGSSDAVLEKLIAKVRQDFPAVRTAAYSPPYRAWSADENRDMVELIRRFDPDVLWVGMTAPKQEKWVHANQHALEVPVIGSIGAVFDYYAGVTRRAPAWVCDLGLEWLYRLPREPRRLWRRTFVSAPTFLWRVVKERTTR